jgi:hypothetical protein
MEFGSDPANRHLSRWEGYAGKRGAGLEAIWKQYRKAKSIRDKAEPLAAIANLHELTRELKAAVERNPGKDETGLKREIGKIVVKWHAMIAEEKLPMSRNQIAEELSEREERINEHACRPVKRQRSATRIHVTNGTIVRERREGGSIANHSGA